MNEQEELVLGMIKENPFISQEELSEIIGLSKSSLANIISSLIKKEYVFGKAYVLNETAPIICIGGANIDRKFYAQNEITAETSNPVKSSRAVGGVARNIAENLGRLGEEVTLLSTAGNDSEWEEIYDLSSPFMNLEHVAHFEHSATGSYTAVLDQNGDLNIALADMDVFEHITPELLIKNSNILRKAKCIVVDLNCPSETIDFLFFFTSKHNIPLVIIPVSSPKMSRLPKTLNAVSWLIVNKDETETFMNVKINDEKDWEDSVKKWLDLGVKNVIVTNGSKGVMTGREYGEIRYFPAIETPMVVDVTGAGDSFCAAVIYSWLQKKDTDYIIKSGLVNAHKTIMSKYTVRQELSQKQFMLDMEAI
ncbi:PfkB family carbohydrate kinase [Lederbergia citrea]|uniref:Winged helix-turn-helix transcriptional regulator n=1 Tax=Lederbergia citrea TaxID=2833581 RepID=A0A942URT3_9BACI|nr:PfkB family carbohydrate kinase [Lederbergia citrea]MBS4179436.1 winged helix-turn-helix transcriptional regulator [Lederbergia citrea]MBS4206104.1 winged helix-turn-helix transcriptional regulator [Lederbergia citrea]MBS4224447.1 winged helix-turn-helix transcriptional regulator [Lederbergia citrea]